MHFKANKYLFDIAAATKRIDKFCNGKSFVHCSNDDQLRSAVERQFEIIGKALNQLTKVDVATANQITDYRHIIAFRNILIHGYADVDDRLVGDLIQTRLPKLKQEIASLNAGAMEP